MSRSIWVWGLLAGFLVLAPTGAANKEQQHRDWALRCSDAKVCRLEQRVFVKGAEKAPLIHVIFQELDQPPGLVVMLRVPLGVLLSRGVQLEVDRAAPQVFPLHHCRLEGCIALFPLTPRLRQTLESGREARVSFSVLDGRQVGVPVSLLGLAAGLKALDRSLRHNDHSSVTSPK